MNLLMPLGQGIVWYISVWAVNGFAHAMMWPPMTKILTAYLSANDYVHASDSLLHGQTRHPHASTRLDVASAKPPAHKDALKLNHRSAPTLRHSHCQGVHNHS
jgi:hypothetical protein